MIAAPPRAGCLRIFSANLLLGRADVSAFSELLRSLDPDVIALQEFAPRHVDAVRAVLTHGQAPLGPRPDMVLALRHPASITPIDGSRDRAFCARLEPAAWPGLTAPIEVLAGHVSAPHIFPPWTTFAARRSEVRGLLRHIEGTPSMPRVLIGDLNASPLWPAYRRLSRAFEDAAIVAAQRGGRRPENTWSPRANGTRLLRIDHALVRSVQVHSLRVIPIAGSDHAGLCIDLTPAATIEMPELATT